MRPDLYPGDTITLQLTEWDPLPGKVHLGGPEKSVKQPRLFVIGDINGNGPLLLSVIEQIRDILLRENGQKASAQLVFLGNLIGPGYGNRIAIEALRQVVNSRYFDKIHFIYGSEEILALNSVLQYRTRWLEARKTYWDQELVTYADEVSDLAKSPKSHLSVLQAIMSRASLGFKFGDLLCVHAGVNPQIPLEDQIIADPFHQSYDQHPSWVGEDFLTWPEDWFEDEKLVLCHGHQTLLAMPCEFEHFHFASVDVKSSKRLCLNAGAGIHAQAAFAEFRESEYRVGWVQDPRIAGLSVWNSIQEIEGMSMNQG